MNTTNANVPTVARRLVLPWAAIVASLAVGFATGLFTGKSFSHTGAPKPAVAATADRPAAAVETFPIVPSPVIDEHPQFFYGTGDGNGSYSDR
jgi:hypothetical protein